MRPLRLTMTAFGPFAGTEVVNFTEALDAGIFGIYGETGAGKTTIFDGISFALFGQSSGAERTAEDLVCHHAHATDVTKVKLVFDLGNRRYVVWRVPAQSRAARRGEGVVSQAHEAYLFDATGMSLEEITEDAPGSVLAEKKVSQVDALIEELLGYDAAQFRQIVLLPQGDFRKILTARNDERSPILKRLFDVSLYEEFSDRIKRDAAALHRKISDERLRRDTHLAGQSEEELAAEIDSMIVGISELETVVNTEGAELTRHQKALSAGEILDEKIKALTSARNDAKALLTEGDAINGLRIRLDKARAAQTVLVTESALAKAKHDATDASKRESLASNSLGNALTRHEETKDVLILTIRQKAEREAAQARVLELERFQSTLDQSGKLWDELINAKTAMQTADDAHQEFARRKSDAEKILSNLRELQKLQPTHASALQKAAGDVALLEKEDENLARYEAALTKRNQRSEEVDRLKIKRDEAITHRKKCQTTHDQAEQNLTEIQALHVARKLVPGEPCPACGSRSHPAPATGDPERRGRHDQFEETGSALRDAERRETEVRTVLSSAESALDERQRELDDFDTPARDRETLLPILNGARAEKKKLEADCQFADLNVRITLAETTAERASSNHEESVNTLSAFKEAAARAQAAYDTLLKDVPDDWRQRDALSKALTGAVKTRDDLIATHERATIAEREAAVAVATAQETFANADKAVQRMSQNLQEAKDGFIRQLEIAGLDEAGFRLARPDVEQTSLLENEINEFDRRVASNEDQIKRLSQEIGDRDAPDLPALTDLRDAAQEKLAASQENLTGLKHDAVAKQAVQSMVEALSRTIRSLESEFAPLGGLSKLVNGDNDRKVRLPDFAIAAMFDEVLAAANLRLGPMTGGRYQLLRPDDSGGGRHKRGLDIAVFDANTEKSRPTKTLSGGEGFQASLALALGLSDVVQRNSGGIKLDAIFIDEGFGTLDEDTLNTALETLYDLTNNMRSVGLISHTEQVKSMITAGFDVELTPSGSHIHPRRTAA